MPKTPAKRMAAPTMTPAGVCVAPAHVGDEVGADEVLGGALRSQGGCERAIEPV